MNLNTLQAARQLLKRVPTSPNPYLDDLYAADTAATTQQPAAAAGQAAAAASSSARSSQSGTAAGPSAARSVSLTDVLSQRLQQRRAAAAAADAAARLPSRSGTADAPLSPERQNSFTDLADRASSPEPVTDTNDLDLEPFLDGLQGSECAAVWDQLAQPLVEDRPCVWQREGRATVFTLGGAGGAARSVSAAGPASSGATTTWHSITLDGSTKQVSIVPFAAVCSRTHELHTWV